MRCKFQPRAKTDLQEIGQYIGQNNRTRAVSYLREIDQYCHKLAQYPDIGRPRPRYAHGLRSMPFGNYVIFYLAKEEEIIIVRVLHSARDIDKIFLDRL